MKTIGFENFNPSGTSRGRIQTMTEPTNENIKKVILEALRLIDVPEKFRLAFRVDDQEKVIIEKETAFPPLVQQTPTVDPTAKYDIFSYNEIIPSMDSMSENEKITRTELALRTRSDIMVGDLISFSDYRDTRTFFVNEQRKLVQGYNHEYWCEADENICHMITRMYGISAWEFYKGYDYMSFTFSGTDPYFTNVLGITVPDKLSYRYSPEEDNSFYVSGFGIKTKYGRELEKSVYPEDLEKLNEFYESTRGVTFEHREYKFKFKSGGGSDVLRNVPGPVLFDESVYGCDSVWSSAENWSAFEAYFDNSENVIEWSRTDIE